MAATIRTVHCLNQFFGGLGGEEAADIAPQWFDGAQGPGTLIQSLAPELEIVGTVVTGDNYKAATPGETAADILALISGRDVDLVLAGPAFNAGRYGMWCAALCRAVEGELNVPAVTALYPESPAVELYRRDVTMVRAESDVMGMRETVARMVRVARKRVAGEAVTPAEDETIPRGLRQNHFAERTGAERAVDMLLRKLAGEDPATEYPMPVFDRVPPAPPVADMASATLALVTSGGVVPRGNPDRIEAASASRFGAYSLEGLEDASAEAFQSVHGGYDPTYANQDPNRVLPLDVVRDLAREGRIGRLHETYYATVGNATSVERAAGFGAEIAAKLVNVGVQAVVLTST